MNEVNAGIWTSRYAQEWIPKATTFNVASSVIKDRIPRPTLGVYEEVSFSCLKNCSLWAINEAIHHGECQLVIISSR